MARKDHQGPLNNISNSLDLEEAPLLRQQQPPIKRLSRLVSHATLRAENLEVPESNVHELKRLSELSLPLIASNVTSFFVTLISMAFIGRLGSKELSIAILATSFFNTTGMTFLIGSLGALETLCGQAFGARSFKQVGTTMQRAMLLTLTLAAIVCLLWLKIESLMLILGQDAALAAGAARFLKIMSPGLFFIGASECLKRYLAAQGIVMPSTIASALSVLAAPVFNYVLIFSLDLGLDGAAVASGLSQLPPLVLLLAWVMWREQHLTASNSPDRTWYGWSKEALQGWGGYLRLAAPSTAMVCLEWWAFEGCVLMAGLLANPELHVAVMGLCLNLSGLLYMLPLGVGAATSIRVSNALGAGLPKAAKRSAYVATWATSALQLVLALGTVLTRNQAGYIFTSEAAVAVAAAGIFPLMALCLLGDGINAVLAGMLRGAGRQELGASINAVSFWVIGLPLAAFLAFKFKLGVAGLWWGLAVCAIFNAGVMLLMLLRMNWEKEAERACDIFAAANIDLNSFENNDDRNRRNRSTGVEIQTLRPTNG